MSSANLNDNELRYLRERMSIQADRITLDARDKRNQNELDRVLKYKLDSNKPIRILLDGRIVTITYDRGSVGVHVEELHGVYEQPTPVPEPVKPETDWGI